MPVRPERPSGFWQMHLRRTRRTLVLRGTDSRRKRRRRVAAAGASRSQPRSAASNSSDSARSFLARARRRARAPLDALELPGALALAALPPQAAVARDRDRGARLLVFPLLLDGLDGLLNNIGRRRPPQRVREAQQLVAVLAVREAVREDPRRILKIRLLGKPVCEIRQRPARGAAASRARSHLNLSARTTRIHVCSLPSGEPSTRGGRARAASARAH